MEQAYNHAKKQLIECNDLTRTEYKGYYGYFEKVDANRKTFSFRLSKSDMEALEGMAKSNYKNLFIE
jgi:hypothetical protein